MRTEPKSAVRTLDLVEALARAQGGLTFTDLQQTLGIPKSSLHELLAVLTSRGYLELDQVSGMYMLGIRIWETGQAYLQHHDLVREARPVMQSIVDALNETVQLAVLDGVENVYLAKIDCSHPIRLQSAVGKRLFAHATGLGKALLANLPEKTLMARLGEQPLPQFTDRTVTDPIVLMRELAIVRDRGFAVDNQEYTMGLRCIAVPIHDHQGQAVAAVSTSIPMMRITTDQLALALRLLAEGSLEIARRLGAARDHQQLRRLADRPAEYLAQAEELAAHPVPYLVG